MTVVVAFAMGVLVGWVFAKTSSLGSVLNLVKAAVVSDREPSSPVKGESSLSSSSSLPSLKSSLAGTWGSKLNYVAEGAESVRIGAAALSSLAQFTQLFL